MDESAARDFLLMGFSSPRVEPEPLDVVVTFQFYSPRVTPTAQECALAPPQPSGLATPPRSRHRTESPVSTPTTQRLAPTTQHSDRMALQEALLQASVEDDEEGEGADEADFHTHDRTVWRSTSRDIAALEHRGVSITSATPLRSLLGLSASPRSARLERVNRSLPSITPFKASTSAALCAEPDVTPTPRAPPRDVTVIGRLVDLRVRKYKWHIFTMRAGDTLDDLSLQAQLAWGCGALVWYRATPAGSAAIIPANTTLVAPEESTALEWCCQEVPELPPHLSDLPRFACYHMLADASGQLSLLLPPVIASSLHAAKVAPAVSPAHKEYLQSLDALAAALRGKGAISLLPFPNVSGGDDDALLECTVVVIHAAIRPGDVAIWHRGASALTRHDTVQCTVQRVYLVNNFPVAEVKALGAMTTHADVMICDLERVW